MKLIELTEDHYIVVDDSEIKEGFSYNPITGELINLSVNGSMSFDEIISKCKNVTHSTKLSECNNGIELLYINEVKALVGKVDIEQLAEQYAKAHSIYESGQDDVAYGFREGYYQCLEDNKDKKYTESDLIKAIYKTWEASQDENEHDHHEIIFNRILQSLQPKKEWEVIFENGKLKLV